MSDEYTPDTDGVRWAYATFGGMIRDEGPERRFDTATGEFDRWLATHDAEVARLQAEHDAGIARYRAKTWNAQSEATTGSMADTSWNMSRGADYVAEAIEAQFPEETGR